MYYFIYYTCIAQRSKDFQLLLVWKPTLFHAYCEFSITFTGPTHFLPVMW